MKYVRMPIEIESPEQMGYSSIRCNLTESSVSDALYRDFHFNLNELVFCYGHHVGKPQLRELIAAEHKNIDAENVLLTAGAATALFIVNTSLLEKGDEIVVMHPNYGTNIETPRAMGCCLKFLEVSFEEKFRLDINKLNSLITDKTKLISITTPHNPTGMMLSEMDLMSLIAIAEEKNIHLLVDETYRDIPFGKPLPLAASLSEKVISVSSVSKSYGLPGLRIGWLICQNKHLMQTFLAAKEQISICNSVVDEEMTYQFLLQKESILPKIKNHILQNYGYLKDWLINQKNLEFILPEGGVVCFPRIKKNLDVENFYNKLNQEYGTYVGPGHWFEMDKRFMRIGFGWPSLKELKEGLEAIDAAFNDTLGQ